MDSGNSGSLQSSSGGDDEYDSRAADSFSAFIKPHGGGPISNSPPPPPQPPPLFDPFSGFLQLNQTNPTSSLLNPNIPWSRPAPRSDPNNSIMNNPMLSASPSFMPSFHQAPSAVGGDSINTRLHHPPPPPQTQHQSPPPPARNPKKRSRASRRAPTTVLTTDTTNFRAMVQEFTGIPSPPFNNSPFPRNRLDIFGTRSTSLDAPPYLRRPFAQKVPSPPPFLSASSSLLNSTALDAIGASSATNNMTSLSPTTTNSTTTTAINYHQPISQTPNLFNPLLNSLLQTNPKFPFSGASPPSIIGSKPQNPPFFNTHQNHIKLGGMEEFGLSNGNHSSATLAGLPNLISSDQIAGRNDQENDNMPINWRNNGVGPDEDNDHHHHQDRMRSAPAVNGGNYNNINQGKMNDYLGSTSAFHGERGTENTVSAGRGEGMVESWICSSE